MSNIEYNNKYSIHSYTTLAEPAQILSFCRCKESKQMPAASL